MCTAENTSIDTVHESHDLPIMTLPYTNGPAHQLEADHYSSYFDFPYHSLSLELERLGSEGILSVPPSWTEDHAADRFFSKAAQEVRRTSRTISSHQNHRGG